MCAKRMLTIISADTSLAMMCLRANSNANPNWPAPFPSGISPKVSTPSPH